jgi:indolepyruvate ferredoxin oxidoreductase beta subunit
MNAPDGKISSGPPISIAILAMGGEGGGVLADWIVNLAENGGYLAQTTSVPGVAQRTGATIYYVELFPETLSKAAGQEPVFALMPTPGDVDVVIASELMEAGRAVQRGLVTPQRTILIASTHRVYAMTEKIALADGRVDPAMLVSSCRAAAKRFIGFEMDALADATGSVISAVLFGALARTGAIPFQRMAFEAAIRRGGVGVSQSLAAFAAGFEGIDESPGDGTKEINELLLAPELRALLASLESTVPADAMEFITAGVARLTDYQDMEYAREFLQCLRPLMTVSMTEPDNSRLLAETARQLALAMSYEDTIRVADLKTRVSRFDRVRKEVQVKDAQILEVVEFMHPRAQEIADTLPASMGQWLLRSAWARPILDRLTRSGRIVKTTSILGFLLLHSIAMLKPLRRRSLRYAREQISLAAWLQIVIQMAAHDRAFAIEIARARGLVKGYGDTYERGHAKFEMLMRQVPILVGPNRSADFAVLHKAAFADEDGTALKNAIMAASVANRPRLRPERTAVLTSPPTR